MTWVCMGCKKPLLVDEGVITISNANADLGPIGSHPLRPSEENTMAPVSTGEGLDYSDLSRLVVRKRNVAFGAYHFGCKPHPNLQSYEIPSGLDAEHWLAWVTHLNEKTWMGKRDLHAMAAFFWTHRGANPPPL